MNHTIGPSHRLPAAVCPACHRKLDHAAPVDSEACPGPGDVSVCAYCAQVNVFVEGGVLRRITAQELADLDPTTRATILAAVNALARFKMKGYMPMGEGDIP